MITLIQFYKKIYRLIFLPIIILVIFYYILIVPIGEGNIWGTVFEPWGAAILLMIINHIYLEHLFTTPRDGLVNSINAVILTLALYSSQELTGLNFSIISIFLILVFLSGLIFILDYNQHKKITLLSKFSSKFGKAKIIFPLIALFTFISFNIDSPNFSINFESDKLFFAAIFYIIFLLLTAKQVINWVRNLPERLLKTIKAERVGIVIANLTPNIIIVEFNANSNIKINDLIVVGELLLDKKGEIKEENANRIGLILDFISSKSENNNVTARVYLLNEPQRDLNESKSGLIKINEECKIIEEQSNLIKNLKSDKVKYYWKRRKDIIGLVTKNSNINILKVEIIRHQQLENAQLVSIINNYPKRPVRYQIIEAETKREIQEEKRDFGYTELLAYQLGEWRKPKNTTGVEENSAFHQFFEFQWVPNMNTLVFRWNPDIDEQDINETDVDTTNHYLLGQIPHTNLPIYLDIKDIVSHHTAVLGVTGCGKTSLVLKLLENINKSDIFTLCLDITGEYKNKIADHIDFFDVGTKDKWNAQLKKIIAAPTNAMVEKTCVTEINKIISDRINILRSSKKIVILEIPAISNTKFSLDYTQYLIQAVLQYAKDIYTKNLTAETKDTFQCCLVIEEAHTIVPENLGIGGDFGASKAVIEKISQIALQGRKYNVGFILISQRTATVKKTVLNQCNTMISFRAYDETSFNFLSSYYGENYVKEITHLKNDGDSRYIIVSGKAVVADRPIIVEIKKPIYKKTPEPTNKTKEPSITEQALEMFGASGKDETPGSPTNAIEI